MRNAAAAGVLSRTEDPSRDMSTQWRRPYLLDPVRSASSKHRDRLAVSRHGDTV